MVGRHVRRRIVIVSAWLLFLAIVGVCFLFMERYMYDRTAREKLSEKSSALSRELSTIVESDYYSSMASVRGLTTRLKTLAFALRPYTDIGDATHMIDEFVREAGLFELDVYDRDGNVVYGGENSADTPFFGRGDVVSTVLDTEFYTITEGRERYDEGRFESLLAVSDTSTRTDRYFWGVGDRWLIVLTNMASDSQKEVMKYLSRNRILQSVKVGDSGYLLMIGLDGTITVGRDPEQEGRSLEELDIRTDRDITTVEGLQELFRGQGSPVRMQVSGTDCYVSKVNIESVVLLLVLPVSEIKADVNQSTLTLLVLMVLSSGLAVLYAVLHADDGDAVVVEKGRIVWNRTMSGKMIIVSLLCIVAVFAGVFYLESLSIYADTFSYTQSKADTAVDSIVDNNLTKEVLQKWADEESLARAGMARCVLDYTDPAEIDAGWLSELAECLGVTYLYRFGADGKVMYTNSPYDRITADGSESFRSMLTGRPYVVTAPSETTFFGEYLQMAAVTIRDDNGASDGFVMVATYPDELAFIRMNMGYVNVFNQVGLSDGIFVMVIKNPGYTVEYLACMDDGTAEAGISSYDYKGMRADTLGIREDRLQDNYNGIMSLFGRSYFASVRRVDDYDGASSDTYLLIMNPMEGISGRHVVKALLATGMTMLFMAVLTVLSGIGPQDGGPGSGEAPGLAEDAVRDEADMLSILRRLVGRNKPFFEDRWPKDCKKWSSRTSSEKFSSIATKGMLVALAFIFLHAWIAGPKSVWYYCVTGKWDSGLNLYSLTSCIISICELLVAKVVLHKLLYLTARVASSRGETVCHLMDNFSGYALFIAGVFICLHHLGVNATALSLTGGVAGVIFGIGCQNVVADILSGIIMTFEGSAYVGEFVSYNGQFCAVLSIGVRTTKLKWFGEITVVRNNDFKNYIRMPSNRLNRAVCTIGIDLKESLQRVEDILAKELPVIHDNLCAAIGDQVEGPVYMGVKSIDGDCIMLSFYFIAKGLYYASLQRLLYAELKKMCDRNDINLAMHQIVVNQPRDYSGKED